MLTWSGRDLRQVIAWPFPVLQSETMVLEKSSMMASGQTEEQATGDCALCGKARSIAHIWSVRTVATRPSMLGLAGGNPLSGEYGVREHKYSVCNSCRTAPLVVLVLVGALGLVTVLVGLSLENVAWVLISTLGTFAALPLVSLRFPRFRVVRIAVKDRLATFPGIDGPKIVATLFDQSREARSDKLVATAPVIEARIGAGDVREETCDLASRVTGGWPAELDRTKLFAVDFEALVAKLRKYQQMTHPGGNQRPEYRLVSGQVKRVSYPLEDFKIATVASMLAGKARVMPGEDAASRFAYQVIQEYGGWRLAKFLFSIPRSYDLQAGGPSGPKTIVIDEFMMDVYSGTENLLFEIYEELVEGEVMDDARVRRRLVALAYS